VNNKHDLAETILSEMFSRQDDFSSLFFDRDNLTEKEREDLTRSFVLALHTEISDLVGAVNFKDHRLVRRDVDQKRILYKSVDAFRYILAIANLWKFNCDDFINAFEDKDLYLNLRHEIEKNVWNGQSVILFDLDDVLNEFRETFTGWLEIERNVEIDYDSTEYYSTKEVKAAGFLPEEVFQDFILERGLRTITPNTRMIEVANRLHDEGYWIQLITARPSGNLTCMYDTYFWLKNSGLKFHNLDFSPEKFRWLVQKDFYDADAVVCAIDDSAKHSSEYAKHGVRVISPIKSYNKELKNVSGVTLYTDPAEAYNLVCDLTNKE
jgi:dimeric dUTPase (all-alpha-NTP-PPase superfamily)